MVKVGVPMSMTGSWPSPLLLGAMTDRWLQEPCSSSVYSG